MMIATAVSGLRGLGDAGATASDAASYEALRQQIGVLVRYALVLKSRPFTSSTMRKLLDARFDALNAYLGELTQPIPPSVAEARAHLDAAQRELEQIDRDSKMKIGLVSLAIVASGVVTGYYVWKKA